jgi:hypothetical protein
MADLSNNSIFSFLSKSECQTPKISFAESMGNGKVARAFEGDDADVCSGLIENHVEFDARKTGASLIIHISLTSRLNCRSKMIYRYHKKLRADCRQAGTNGQFPACFAVLVPASLFHQNTPLQWLINF